MNSPFEVFVTLFFLSGMSWGIYGFYISIRINRFIAKRYEQETELLNTIYFAEHATFTRKLPVQLSSALYTGHLLTFLWGWNFFKKRKAYRDIKDAREVIRYFSDKEIRLVNKFGLSGLVFLVHMIAFCIFRVIWPDAFG